MWTTSTEIWTGLSRKKRRSHAGDRLLLLLRRGHVAQLDAPLAYLHLTTSIGTSLNCNCGDDLLLLPVFLGHLEEIWTCPCPLEVLQGIHRRHHHLPASRGLPTRPHPSVVGGGPLVNAMREGVGDIGAWAWWERGFLSSQRPLRPSAVLCCELGREAPHRPW